MEKKKILVTGGAGFIGSHLCEKLIEFGSFDVYSLDNYFTGHFNNHIAGVKYIHGNTMEISQLIDFTPELIYHLGEYSRVEQSFDDIDKVWDYNIKGTYAVLEFVRIKGCKLIYAGSSTKFGDSGSGRDATPYAWTKATNTELVKNYASWFNIKYAITYFYNVYGGRELSDGKYATVVGIFKKKMSQSNKLTVVSPGTQKRNFTHIEDIIEGLVLVGEQGSGDEYGIGSNEAFSILELAEMFGGEIEMIPRRNGNRQDADLITKKTKELGWSPKKNLKEYIQSLNQTFTAKMDDEN